MPPKVFSDTSHGYSATEKALNIYDHPIKKELRRAVRRKAEDIRDLTEKGRL